MLRRVGSNFKRMDRSESLLSPMPAGDASLKTAQVEQMLIDSNHGIYRDIGETEMRHCGSPPASQGRATVRHETARIHHPPRRRGARMAARGAGRVLQWIDCRPTEDAQLHINLLAARHRCDESEPIGPRMPPVRPADRAGRRWSPLRPFSAEERGAARTDLNEFITAIY